MEGKLDAGFVDVESTEETGAGAKADRWIRIRHGTAARTGGSAQSRRIVRKDLSLRQKVPVQRPQDGVRL